MDTCKTEVTQVPMARPLAPAAADRGLSSGFTAASSFLAPLPAPPRDGCCVASAVCGFTALVPIVSQLAGLVLGIIGLVRIAAARRLGVPRRGAGWAVAGICCSGILLLCWLGIFAALLSAGRAFDEAAGGMPF